MSTKKSMYFFVMKYGAFNGLIYYKNFVIEQKFGFNKMTKQIFITDKIKSYILMILIGFVIVDIKSTNVIS